MISHTRKYIFVHINKTGGTSVEAKLRKISKHHGNKHYNIIKYRNLANNEHGFENYFKFTIVRNPWDRLVSNYFFRKRRGKSTSISFKDWVVKNKFDGCNAKHTQLSWISDETGELIIDFIGRFENLQEDFNIICERIGVPHQQLAHKNKSKHKHYTEYYDEETKQIVAEKYAKDIEYFGYKFGE